MEIVALAKAGALETERNRLRDTLRNHKRDADKATVAQHLLQVKQRAEQDQRIFQQKEALLSAQLQHLQSTR